MLKNFWIGCGVVLITFVGMLLRHLTGVPDELWDKIMSYLFLLAALCSIGLFVPWLGIMLAALQESPALKEIQAKFRDFRQIYSGGGFEVFILALTCLNTYYVVKGWLGDIEYTFSTCFSFWVCVALLSASSGILISRSNKPWAKPA